MSLFSTLPIICASILKLLDILIIYYGGFLKLLRNAVKWEEKEVPSALFTGDHAKIKDWRLTQSEDITRRRRPDLWKEYKKNK